MYQTDDPEAPDPFVDGLPGLDGGRVRLRPVREGDEPDLLAVFGDAGHLRYWSHGPLDGLEAAREYREGIEAGTRDRTFFQWAVTVPPGDRLVGTVTLGSWDRANRRAEIGFIVRPDRQGEGVASAAVRAALAFGAEAMRLHRVEADVDPDNAGSRALLERLGFVYEGRLRERWFTFGTWKDSLIYGWLADGP